ncbi:unnamed protein product [Strongylus vulgaris]|uniref:Uncharacterized protein n=1 Tax=Strongylus vulgaris TaxID=40348 RepID=A0A3P7JW44_STRVU|nr:unnamed protein product [Strongylus vulgaris]
MTFDSEAADDNPVTVRFHCNGNCCDHHEWCRFWASVGECKRGWGFQKPVLGSIVVSIRVCHMGDPASIPGRGEELS